MGLRSLLVEWGAAITNAVLYIDNQSALTVAADGGTWRTRYFSVRAARLHEET